MAEGTSSTTVLRSRIADLEGQLARLKFELADVERRSSEDKDAGGEEKKDDGSISGKSLPLSLEEYKRYGRQMIVPEIGLKGQLLLKRSSVLIIGIGGLGCPAAAYLASAGVGTIGLVDGDVVETSNLHRQIAHSTARVGWGKVESAMEYLKGLNPLPTYIPHTSPLTPESAVPLAQPYDLILDCTDRPTTRYLASDTAVVLQKPLITAAALRAEGQLMVLNHPALPQGDSAGAPCYRCVFPRAPAPESLLSCGDAGVLGPVVGVMGVLMAVEAIRLLAVRPRKQEEEQHHSPPSLHLFTPLTHTPFRTIRLRPRRRPSCPACSPSATITASSLLAGTYSYTAFCGLPSTTTLLAPSERVSALEYSSHQKQEQHVLIDTREPAHFDVHSLPGSINVPISLFRSGRDAFPVLPPAPAPIYVICQRGNDSQVAVRALKAAGLDDGGRRFIGDIRGGLRAWREEVDAGWPDF